MLCFFALVISVFSYGYFEVKGETSYKLGYELGKLMNTTIRDLYHYKTVLLKDYLHEWKIMSKVSLPTIIKFAPTSYNEMMGISDSSGIGLDVLLLLNTEYEISLLRGVASKHCTGFVSQKGTHIITGQTDDEVCDDFLGMEGMSVQKRNEDSLIFAYQGYMGYMGMNKHGITVLWQTIDNNEFLKLNETFVPTTILIRELLTKSSIFEAIEYLNSVPRGCPNNIILSKPGEGFADVEFSPTNFTVQLTLASKYGKDKISDFCHTNNVVFSQSMIDGDLSRDPTTVPRFQTCRSFMKNIREHHSGDGFSVDSAKELVNTPPIKRDGKWRNVWSCSILIFDPQSLEMNVKYYKEDMYHLYKMKKQK